MTAPHKSATMITINPAAKSFHGARSSAVITINSESGMTRRYGIRCSKQSGQGKIFRTFSKYQAPTSVAELVMKTTSAAMAAGLPKHRSIQVCLTANASFIASSLPSSHHAHWTDHDAVGDLLLLSTQRGIKRIERFLESLDATLMRRKHRLATFQTRRQRCGRAGLHHLLIHIVHRSACGAQCVGELVPGRSLGIGDLQFGLERGDSALDIRSHHAA